MLVVRPDFDRRVDLPGAGPCSRPVDIDRLKTGFARLVSLRVYSFAQDTAIDGEAEGDEVFIVLMRGAADFVVANDGTEVGSFALREGDGLRAIYMPPRSSYRLRAAGTCDIAYARVEPGQMETGAVQGFAAKDGKLDVIGYAAGMDLTLANVSAGAVASLGRADAAPERFVHLRAMGEMAASAGGELLVDWDSLAVNACETIMLTVMTGTAAVLTVSATGPEMPALEGANNEP